MDKQEFLAKEREITELAGRIGGIETEEEFVASLPPEALPFFQKDKERIMGQSRWIAALRRTRGGHGSPEAYQAAMQMRDAAPNFTNSMLAICLYYPYKIAETEWHKAERKRMQLQAFRCLQVYYQPGIAHFMRPVKLQNSNLSMKHVQVDMLEYIAGFKKFGEAQKYVEAGNTEPPDVPLGGLPISFR